MKSSGWSQVVAMVPHQALLIPWRHQLRRQASRQASHQPFPPRAKPCGRYTPPCRDAPHFRSGELAAQKPATRMGGTDRGRGRDDPRRRGTASRRQRIRQAQLEAQACVFRLPAFVPACSRAVFVRPPPLAKPAAARFEPARMMAAAPRRLALVEARRTTQWRPPPGPCHACFALPYATGPVVICGRQPHAATSFLASQTCTHTSGTCLPPALRRCLCPSTAEYVGVRCAEAHRPKNGRVSIQHTLNSSGVTKPHGRGANSRACSRLSICVSTRPGRGGW